MRDEILIPKQLNLQAYKITWSEKLMPNKGQIEPIRISFPGIKFEINEEHQVVGCESCTEGFSPTNKEGS